MTAMPAVQVLALDDVFSHALRGELCYLTFGAERLRLPVEEWTRPTDEADEVLLRHCVGATLDIGCGPGRMTAELAARGHVALGIDVVSEAVGQTHRRGAPALHRDVFGPVPGSGRWETALLADGNIGIGGDPVALLDRVRRILRPGGRVVVETAPRHHRSEVLDARLECHCGRSDPFGWAVVSRDDMAAIARASGLVEIEQDDAHGRWVSVLTESTRSAR